MVILRYLLCAIRFKLASIRKYIYTIQTIANAVYVSTSLCQIMQQEGELSPNTWYNVSLENFDQGSEGFQLLIQNNVVQSSVDIFSPLDFSILNGGVLYIGGHPSPKNIEVWFCACVYMLHF